MGSETSIRDGERAPVLGWRSLTGEQRFWLAAAALTGALSVMKGLRRPNLWAATGLQLDYSQGPIKRGLLGEALERLHLPVGHMLFVQGFAALVAILLAGLFLRLAWTAARRDALLVVALTVFASSAAPAYIAHLLGYPDLVLATVAVGVASLSPAWWRPIVVAAASVIAVLIHEEYLLLFLPVTLLPLLLDAWKRPDVSAVHRAAALAAPAVAALATGGTALWLSLTPPLSAERMAQLLHRQAARANFPLRADEFDVLVRSAADNVAATSAYPFWWDNLAALLIFAPSTAVLLVWAWRRLATAPTVWPRALARAAVIAAALAPLLMHVVGWDHFRWDAWMLFDAFLALCIVMRATPGAPETTADRPMLSERARWAVLLLVLLNVGTGGGFMDGRTPRLFPFTDWWTGWPRAQPAPEADNTTDEDDKAASAQEAAPSRPATPGVSLSAPAVQRP